MPCARIGVAAQSAPAWVTAELKRLWYAIYKNTPQEETHTEERAPRTAVLKRFDDTATLAGMHDSRAVIGMWLIDEATNDVVRIYGLSR